MALVAEGGGRWLAWYVIYRRFATLIFRFLTGMLEKVDSVKYGDSSHIYGSLAIHW